MAIEIEWLDQLIRPTLDNISMYEQVYICILER